MPSTLATPNNFHVMILVLRHHPGKDLSKLPIVMRLGGLAQLITDPPLLAVTKFPRDLEKTVVHCSLGSGNILSYPAIHVKDIKSFSENPLIHSNGFIAVQ